MSNYVNHLMLRKIHILRSGKMCINMWIMWITYAGPYKIKVFGCV